MFIHETHSFYIIARFAVQNNAHESYMERKLSIFNQALSNLDVEALDGYDYIWMVKDVMYSAADIFDIINNEMVRLVATASDIPASEKKLYELSSRTDSIIVSEFIQENTYRL